MYFAYVNSRILYMSSLWSSAPKYILESVDILQRKALRIVFMKDFRCSRRELYSEDILPATISAEIHSVILIFKMLNNMIINNVTFTFLNQIHSHATRNVNNFIVPFCNTQFGCNNFYIRALRNYNNLPIEIKKINSLSIFKRSIKEFMYDSIVMSDV